MLWSRTRAGAPAKTAPSPAASGVQATSLAAESDWQAIRPRLEELESRCALNPWATWTNAFELWRQFSPGQRAWFVEIPNPPGRAKGLLAGGIFLEEKIRRKGLPLTTLRSIDQMAMRLPPFWMAAGHEPEACRAMAAALPEISAAAGADMLAFYRQDAASAAAWLDELARGGVFHRSRVFTESNLLLLPDDFEGWLQNLPAGIPRNLAKAERRVLKDFGQAAEYIHIDGHILHDYRMRDLWPAFETLREKSWQYEEAQQKGSVDTAYLTEYFRRVVKYWSRRGWLDFGAIRFGDKVAAAVLGLIVGGRYYGLITVYDRDFGRYSAGKLALVDALRALHARGVRLIELGGEGSQWKTDWATSKEPLLQIEIPLPTFKGRLWKTLARLRSAPAAPVR